jgi:ubiquitin-conjugating enzyme E2 J1
MCRGCIRTLPMSFRHFTIRGPEDTEFAGGVYHGRIVLPSDYPFKPPGIMMLTPNGRFETHKKICLSASDFHPELWQPAWYVLSPSHVSHLRLSSNLRLHVSFRGIRTMLEALRAFFPTPGDGAVRALDYPPEVRKKMAKESLDWQCDVCKRKNKDIVEECCTPLPTDDSTGPAMASPNAKLNVIELIEWH